MLSAKFAVAGKVEAYRLLRKIKDELAIAMKNLQTQLVEQTQIASAKETRVVTFEAKVTTLEEARQKEQVWEQKVKELEEQLATTSTEADKAICQLMEAARMVKAT